eukprot:Clim_evm10s196 gene=Clim_evmTU10s196
MPGSFSLVIDNDDPDRTVLHLSETDYKAVFGKLAGTEPAYVSLTCWRPHVGPVLLRPLKGPQHRLVVTAKSNSSSCTKGICSLSANFAERHGFQRGDVLSMAALHTLPVATVVVLEAQDHDSYKALSEQSQDLYDLFSAGDSIARTGEILQAPSMPGKVKVLETHPCTQAVVDSDGTEFVVLPSVKPSNQNTDGHKATNAPVERTVELPTQPLLLGAFRKLNMKPMSEAGTLAKSNSLEDHYYGDHGESTFLLQNLRPPSLRGQGSRYLKRKGSSGNDQISPNSNSSSKSGSACDEPGGAHAEYHIMPAPLYEEGYATISTITTGTIWLGWRAMAANDLVTGGYAYLHLGAPMDEKRHVKRLVQVRVWDAPMNDTSAVVSRDVLQQISRPSEPLSWTGKLHALNASRNGGSPVAVADRLVLRQVVTSTYLRASGISTALRQYFASATRLLKKGDVIAIPLVGSSGDGQTMIDFTKDPRTATVTPDLVWFTVNEISGSSDATDGFLLVRADTTRIVQEGISQPKRLPLELYEPLGDFLLPLHSVYRKVAKDAHLKLISEVLAQRDGEKSSGPLDMHDHSESIPFHNMIQLEKVIGMNFHAHSFSGSRANSVSAILIGPMSSGKRAIASAAAAANGVDFLEINCSAFSGLSGAGLDEVLESQFAAARRCAPVVFFMRNVDVLAPAGDDPSGSGDRAAVHVASTLRRLMDHKSEHPMTVIATVRDVEDLSIDCRALFSHEIELKPPKLEEREVMLRKLLDRHPVNLQLSQELTIRKLAELTVGILPLELTMVVEHAFRHAADALMAEYSSDDEIASAAIGRQFGHFLTGPGLCLTSEDVDYGVDRWKGSKKESIGVLKKPNVFWEDIGGMEKVKEEILDLVELPLQRPELFAGGLSRSGVLLYGPPGTGKTLVAKAVATECNLNFLSVKGPELINMYIGQSEKNIRQIFERGRNAAPCVIFFDELDSLAPARGKSGDSGGVMDRIVSQLLAEIDGMDSGEKVFVIGATNRPDLIDPALLRPGRFDRLLYLGVSEDERAALKIVEAQTRKLNVDVDVDLLSIVRRCPKGLTGADYYALCSSAMMQALRRTITEFEAAKAKYAESGGPEDKAPKQPKIILRQEDLEYAVANIKPSVSEADMQRYRDLQKQFLRTDQQQQQSSKPKKQNETALPKIVEEDKKGKGEHKKPPLDTVPKGVHPPASTGNGPGPVNGSTNGNYHHVPANGSEHPNGNGHGHHGKGKQPDKAKMPASKNKGKGKAPLKENANGTNY